MAFMPHAMFCLQYCNQILNDCQSESDLEKRIYDVIFELNLISANMLHSVMAQLEYKLHVSFLDPGPVASS